MDHRQAPAAPPILAPRSIAVIGASDTPGSLGGRVMAYQRKFGFPGPVWPVNPRRDEVAGERCYHTPAELPAVPDLAILAVSAVMAQDAVRSCIDAGIRHGILWAGGFAETGEEGAARQAALAGLCREAGFQLCGPNTVGIINTHLPMAATFAANLQQADRLIPGDISIVSQSGGTAVNAHAVMQAAGFGLRYAISSGNEAVLTLPDYLRMLAEDPETRVVAAYLEGVRDGANFVDALERLQRAGKPLVILKAGAAEASARAAAAHTGALTGEYRVWKAVLEAHGAVMVRSQREMVEVALLLSGQRLERKPEGRRVAVMALHPETAAIAAAQMQREGLQAVAAPVVVDAPSLPATLLALAPEADALLLDASFDLGETDLVTLAEGLADCHTASGKPVVIALDEDAKPARELLARRGIYAFPTLARAGEALGRVLNRREASPRPALPPVAFDWRRHVPDARPGLVVSEHECHRILAAGGLPVARGALVAGAAEAAAAATDIGFPVAMKGISPAITHRAAAGLLLLGVADAAGAAQGFALLQECAAARGASLDGVYVQHMESGATEVIVAAFRDPMFGVMVTCGAGGTATEILDDVAIDRAPLDQAGAEALLRRLRLVAARDGGPALAPLAEFVARFSQLAASIPWPAFALEVNPVKWREDAVVAVDGLLLIENV